MRTESLQNLISISKGKKHKETEDIKADSKRIIRIEDLRNNKNIILTNDRTGTEVNVNDVLIAWDGANAGTIGYGKIGFIGSTIARLRIKDQIGLDTIYLCKFLQTQYQYLRATSTGATIPHINRNALLSIKIPLPSLEDQKRIASILTRAEKLIAKRKESIQLFDNFLKNTFLDMFGILDSSYNKWDLAKLSVYSIIVSGVTKGKKYVDQELIEVPYMRVANVQDGHLNLEEIKTIYVSRNEYNRYLLKRGDVLLTEGGDPDKLGRGSVWEEQIKDCIHQNHIFRVRILNSNELNPYYLSGLIGSVYGKSYFLKSAKQTTGIASINSTQLKNFPIIIPPIELQNQFASIVEKVESIKSRYRQSLTELENLYGSLSQRAFKGELDLRRIPLEKEPESQEHITDARQPQAIH